MAEKTKREKIRLCPYCKTTPEDKDEKSCPACGVDLLTHCPSCRAILEENGDARECRACGFKFEEE
ncbi:MAG TPA: hypothetical protein VGJ94_01605 [Syntrophorhabdaceae bacterium]